MVYGVPILTFSLLVGGGPLRDWNRRMGLATWHGLRFYGLLTILALVVIFVLTIVYEIVDPAALQLLNRPNPALQQATGDPWFFVGFSFVIGAFEETIFRGFIFGYWRDRSGPWMVPAVWTSVVFAGVHLYYGTTYGAAAPLIFPGLFLLGFAFAATYRFSGGNLVVPAVLHGAHDAAAFLTLVSLARWPHRSLLRRARRRADRSHPLPTERFDRALLSPVSIMNETRVPSSMDVSDPELREVLGRAKTIAVVGLSDKPERDSNEVARYLQSQGYRIVPVNPMLTQVLGEKSYPSLAAIPAEVRVDIVDVFRRSDQVPPVVDEAIQRGDQVVWMQLGVENAEAAAKARAAGLTVFENLCIMVQHRRLRASLPSRPT